MWITLTNESATKNHNDNYWYIGETNTGYLWRQLLLPEISYSYDQIKYTNQDGDLVSIEVDANIHSVEYSTHEVEIDEETTKTFYKIVI